MKRCMVKKDRSRGKKERNERWEGRLWEKGEGEEGVSFERERDEKAGIVDLH